jgi:3-isopropylmalate dehydrogenase
VRRDFDVAVLAGDGIGREVTAPCLTVLERLAVAVGIRLRVRMLDAGADCYLRTGTALSDETFEAARAADAILLGAMGLPGIRYANGTEIAPQIDLRERLDLYAGVRPLRVVPGAPTPLADPRAREIDCVLVRESTEGLFFARRQSRRENDAVFDTMRISRTVCERLFTFAFELARRRRETGAPGRVTCVDKANVLPAMAFFRSCFLDAARKYSDIQTDCLYVDAAGLQLVRAPWTFDVIVTENMFGDILSDVGAALIGGMGMAPSADIGDGHAVFQPCHGSAPDIAGRGIANPTAMLLSVAMMLNWLGERHATPACRYGARVLTKAVDAAFRDGRLVTAEHGGAADTATVIATVLAAVDRELLSADIHDDAR